MQPGEHTHILALGALAFIAAELQTRLGWDTMAPTPGFSVLLDQARST